MSPSASSSIHFLPQFRHNTTKAPNSNTKQKAETILGGLPIKPWVLTDKEQIARERSCGEYRRRRASSIPSQRPDTVTQTPTFKYSSSSQSAIWMPQEPKMSMSANKLDATIHFYTKPPSISLDGSWRDLSDVSNLVDWLIVLKVMKLKPSLVKKVGIETTQARNHSFGSMHLDEIAEVVLDRLWREREVQTYQNGMAKKVGEEDDDVDNLIEFLALTGDRSEEDALLTVLKDKTGQHVLAKVGSGKSEDIMQSIFRPREHTSLEKEDKHKGRSNASLKNSGNMIDFQDSANNTIQQSPFLPINVEDAPFIQTNTATAKSSDISAVGEKSTTDHALQGSQLAFGDHDDDHAVQCVDECGCVVRESTPSGRTPFTFAMVTAKLVVIATNVTAE
ncbi:hypothetical protein BLNAU_5301 [Blattamonas nauphoetae]|nr:hypothetical protein BLNAU_18675 [Blattamonas nauphoetae]KAK2959812.1 hypothetical protein BLNAU_5301 [Blattamonas nauphoetae]